MFALIYVYIHHSFEWKFHRKTLYIIYKFIKRIIFPRVCVFLKVRSPPRFIFFNKKKTKK